MKEQDILLEKSLRNMTYFYFALVILSFVATIFSSVMFHSGEFYACHVVMMVGGMLLTTNFLHLMFNELDMWMTLKEIMETEDYNDNVYNEEYYNEAA